MQLSKKIVLIIISIIILYSIFLFLSDLEKISDKIFEFKFEFLPVIFLFVIASWFCVYARWNFLLKTFGITIPHKQNFQIFMGGSALGITPGKVGELFKSQFLKEKFNIPRTTSAPLIIAEKFYDIVAAVIISVIGIWFIPELGYVLIAGILVLFIVFKILNSKKIFNNCIKILSKLKFLENLIQPLSSSHDILQKTLSGKTMLFSILLSIAYWISTGLACYFVILGFGIDTIPLLNSISTYSSSIIAGALSFIPGGIGIAEGSLVSLLSIQNIEISEALILVIFIRLFTLWFTTITGFIMIKTSNSIS